MSHLPRIPPYLPHHRPLSASRLKKSVQCFDCLAINIFILVTFVQFDISNMCLASVMCVFIAARSLTRLFCLLERRKKHFHPVYAIKTFPVCCICPGSLFRKVLKSTWGCRALKSTLLISPQYPAPCTPPNTPRAPQTLGLATVRSFVCGRGGVATIATWTYAHTSAT